MRHPAPRAARLRDETKTVEHLAQVMLPVLAVLAAQQQIRQDEHPLFLTHIRQIRTTINTRHPSMLSKINRRAKTLARFKLHNFL